VFARVWFDICAGCSAKCPWCQTGCQARQGKPVPNRVIAPDDFSRAIDYMLAQGILGANSSVDIYNFGEPLLHPQLQEIVASLHRAGLKFGLSTNASRVRTLNGSVLENLQYITFSMPGFSQASYDRIHGLNFETIKANIPTLVRNFRECGFRGTPYIAYHVYQFNMRELDEACRFAVENDLGLEASCAFFNDLDMSLSFLDSTMPYEQLKRASQELVLYYVEDLRASQPADFQCKQWNELTLNERCQVVLCCAATKNKGPGILGDLFQMSDEAIRQAKAGHQLCSRCLASGNAYWGHHPLRVRTIPQAANAALRSPDDFAGVSFVEQPSSCAGLFNGVSLSDFGTLIAQGWARNPAGDCAANEILLVDDRRRIVACGPVNLPREDIVQAANLDHARSRNCGWRIRFDRHHLSTGSQRLFGYAFDRATKTAYRLSNSVAIE
jgi:pyruvate-formate lyase-activating enzyme